MRIFLDWKSEITEDDLGVPCCRMLHFILKLLERKDQQETFFMAPERPSSESFLCVVFGFGVFLRTCSSCLFFLIIFIFPKGLKAKT